MKKKPCAHGFGMIRAVINEKQKAEKKGTGEKKGGEKEKKKEEKAAMHKPNGPMGGMQSRQEGGEV